MATCGDIGRRDGSERCSLKESLEAQLLRANQEKAKIEAALRFPAANPDAEAFIQLARY